MNTLIDRHMYDSNGCAQFPEQYPWCMHKNVVERKEQQHGALKLWRSAYTPSASQWRQEDKASQRKREKTSERTSERQSRTSLQETG